eukprot:TRINITY_DN174_c1_g2_i12.p1 TRINITY_DN174_c1_g2~~TRINITY_DN174_c1_g2_i12.p1  ORF type:complete len:328 (-),score=44.70 TRINITY_DN174_c1_g2_i12:40-1023(-)
MRPPALSRKKKILIALAIHLFLKMRQRDDATMTATLLVCLKTIQRKLNPRSLSQIALSRESSFEVLSGVEKDVFEFFFCELFQETEFTTNEPELTNFDKLFAFFFWMRHHPSMALLSELLGVSTPAVSRMISHFACKFACKFCQLVRMPPLQELQNSYFLGDKAIGALDGTNFDIAHPYHSSHLACDFYRGDKKRHFNLALILSDKRLRVIWAALGIPGHCNDQRAFKNSNLYPWLLSEGKNVSVLADGGFTGESFLRPVVKPVTSTALLWNEVLRQERAGAEHCNCYLKHWKVLSGTFHGDISLHTLVVYCVIIIHNARLIKRDLK